MSRKLKAVEARPGYLCTLIENSATPEGPGGLEPVAHITRMSGDYALVDANTGEVIPKWPPGAVDALIEYRASRVQGVVPPKDPADA